MIIRNNAGDMGLLEHEFRDENSVGIAGLTPGQIAAVPAVPIHKRASEVICLESHRWTQINTDVWTLNPHSFSYPFFICVNLWRK